MCRFLMVKSKKNLSIAELIFEFAQKSKESREWQGDGWGVSWLDSKNKWRVSKSLSPIWENVKALAKVPESKIFLVHARSSSSDKDKDCLEYNQPFIREKIALVFNGSIIGMRTSVKIPGKIGSQKIFHLIEKCIPNYGIEDAIRKTRIMIEHNSREIEALNIGICDKEKFYLLCRHNGDEDYYGIRYFKDGKITIVCSEQISTFPFRTMKNGQLLII